MVIRRNVKLADVAITYEGGIGKVNVVACGPMWMIENAGDTNVTIKMPEFQAWLQPGQHLNMASRDGQLLC